MIEAVLLASIALSAACATFFWLRRDYNDCVMGRGALFGMIAAALIVGASVARGYRYSNILPEIALALGSNATFMVWLVWRYWRKQWRIRAGLDNDAPQL
jgi:hypothetical protein